MNDEAQGSLEDLNQAAEELIALGCAAGAMHIHDGVARLGFLGEVSAFVDEVVEDVKEGVISAAEGVAVFWDERQELRDKLAYYGRNGFTFAGGVTQIYLSVGVTVATRGASVSAGIMYGSHGVNNIYEASMNIYNGHGATPAEWPVRKFYQYIASGEYEGNMMYGAADIGLSLRGLLGLVRKPETFQLFRSDPLNYERAYKKMGVLALFFESVVNSITVESMYTDSSKHEFERPASH